MNDWNGKTTFANDSLGRVKEINDHNDKKVAFTYDGIGNRKSIKYPDDSVVNYEYNPANLITKVIDGENLETIYNYDERGNLSELLYPNGDKETYNYNSLGELTKTSLTNAVSLNETREYSHDKLGNIVKEISNINGKNIVTEYNYDQNNRLSKVSKNNEVSEYIYDSLGNISKEITPDGQIDYQYNNLNQLTSKTTPDGDFSYLYDKRGNLIEELKDGAINRTFEFDETNRMVKGVNADSEESIYGYNGLMARISVEKTIKNPNIDYHNNKNSLARTEILALENGIVPMPPITSAQDSLFKTYITDNALTMQNEEPTIEINYVLDYQNVFKKPLMTYGENSHTTIYTYGYDKIKERIQKEEDITNLLIALPSDGINETEEADDFVQTKLISPNVKIATEVLNTSYYHQTYIGTTNIVTNEEGYTIAKPSIDEWGEVFTATKIDMNIEGIEDVNNFTGHSLDNVVGTYYAQARIYNQSDKRFSAEDTHWDSYNMIYGDGNGAMPNINAVRQSRNLYAYVDNNPINRIDITGKFSLDIAKSLAEKTEKAFNNALAAMTKEIQKYTKHFTDSLRFESLMKGLAVALATNLAGPGYIGLSVAFEILDICGEKGISYLFQEYYKESLGTLDKKIINSFIYYEDSYYLGKMIGDLSGVAVGLFGAAKGLTKIIEGIKGAFAGAGLSVGSGGTLSVVGASIGAASVALAGVGAVELAAASGVILASSKNLGNDTSKFKGCNNTSGSGGGSGGYGSKFKSVTTNSFWKSYKKLDKKIQKAVDNALELFEKDPSRKSLNFEPKKQFGKNVWAIKVNDKYRIMGIKDGNTVTWYEVNNHYGK